MPEHCRKTDKAMTSTYGSSGGLSYAVRTATRQGLTRALPTGQGMVGHWNLVRLSPGFQPLAWPRGEPHGLAHLARGDNTLIEARQRADGCRICQQRLSR